MLKTVHQRCVMRMRMNTMDVRMRLGDAIDPCHLANGFEAVIGYECQERSELREKKKETGAWQAQKKKKNLHTYTHIRIERYIQVGTMGRRPGV